MAEVWDNSTAFKKALQEVMYLYLEHVSNASTNNALYTEPPSREKLFMCKLQNPKLPTVFEVFCNIVVPVLVIKEPVPFIQGVVEL